MIRVETESPMYLCDPSLYRGSLTEAMPEKFWLKASVASGSNTPKLNSWIICNENQQAVMPSLLSQLHW